MKSICSYKRTFFQGLPMYLVRFGSKRRVDYLKGEKSVPVLAQLEKFIMFHKVTGAFILDHSFCHCRHSYFSNLKLCMRSLLE